MTVDPVKANQEDMADGWPEQARPTVLRLLLETARCQRMLREVLREQGTKQQREFLLALDRTQEAGFWLANAAFHHHPEVFKRFQDIQKMHVTQEASA